MVVPSAYLPPISWFAGLKTDEPILVEQYENYHKQTIRNRCTIDSPNGPLNLSVPIDRGAFAGGKCLMKDVRISTHSDWQHQHWYALETSYFNSPFFEYLQDDFRPFYERQWSFLMDFNEALTEKCLELLDLHPAMQRTDRFLGLTDGAKGAGKPIMPGGAENASQAPAEPVKTVFPPSPYYQVFAYKHGFLPNLSIIDLIFNMGNESVLVLNR